MSMRPHSAKDASVRKSTTSGAAKASSSAVAAGATTAASGAAAPKQSSSTTYKAAEMRAAVTDMAITPDMVWANRNNINSNAASGGGGGADDRAAAGASSSSKRHKHAADSPPRADGQREPAAGVNSPTSPPQPQQQPQHQPQPQPQQPQQSATADHMAQAAARTAASTAAAAALGASLKTNSTVVAQELAALRDENAQLRDIEKQFWLLLDEREQLQTEVRDLQHGITRTPSGAGVVVAAHGGGGGGGRMGADSLGMTLGGGSSKQMVRPPPDPAQAERNYSQMATALDEALAMLLQMDKSAASHAFGSGGAAAVAPGTMIYRFLEFCASERLGGGGGGGGGGSRGSALLGAPGSSPSNFAGRTAAMLAGLQPPPEMPSGHHHTNNNNNGSSSTMSTSAGHQVSGGDSSLRATQHASSLSQALRTAQDEIHHLKMELDRSDLSRLQALDDVDKMQKQIKLLSQSIVELRSAYASARAQADANARSAETTHEVTVRLAERDAEMAHLKGRLAEMQRMAASGGSLLAGDAARIRSELQARKSAASSVEAH